MQSGRINQETIASHEASPGPAPHSSIMEENARLRQQIEMSTSNERMASSRYAWLSIFFVYLILKIRTFLLCVSIERLESLLEEYRRRESEEASSLERSMEQIESNLKIATVIVTFIFIVNTRCLTIILLPNIAACRAIGKSGHPAKKRKSTSSGK